MLIATDLPGAGRAGDEEMRHSREIDDHRLAADGLAERDGELVLRVGEILAGDQLAQIDHLAALIRQFDADGVAAGDDRDAGRDRRHGARDVVGEANDARTFDAGRRLQLIKRDHRAGAHVDDVALDGKILEHALEQTRILFQRVLRELHAARLLLGLGEQVEGRRFIARVDTGRRGAIWGPRPAGRRRRNRIGFVEIAGARRRVHRIDILLLERRLDARVTRRRRPVGRPRAAPPEPAGRPRRRRFQRQPKVDERAERNQRHARLAAGVVVIVGARTDVDVIFGRPAAHVGFGFEAETRGAGHGEDRDKSGDGAEHRHQDSRAGEDCARNGKDGVAGDAAEAGGQRPAIGRWQQRRGRGGREEADEPQTDAEQGAADPSTSHQTQALGRNWQDGGDGAKADKLHQQIGDDRARRPEKIADMARGRVVERRIAGRPADQRHCQSGGGRHQKDAQQLSQPPRREFAKLLGEVTTCMATHVRRSPA